MRVSHSVLSLESLDREVAMILVSHQPWNGRVIQLLGASKPMSVVVL